MSPLLSPQRRQAVRQPPIFFSACGPASSPSLRVGAVEPRSSPLRTVPGGARWTADHIKMCLRQFAARGLRITAQEVFEGRGEILVSQRLRRALLLQGAPTIA